MTIFFKRLYIPLEDNSTKICFCQIRKYTRVFSKIILGLWDKIGHNTRVTWGPLSPHQITISLVSAQNDYNFHFFGKIIGHAIFTVRINDYDFPTITEYTPDLNNIFYFDLANQKQYETVNNFWNVEE